MGERRDDLRAADSDRQFVADRLQVALNEGRLNLSEYDERLQQAYTAKTYGELDRILDDLPPVTSPHDARVAPAASGTNTPSGTPSAPGASGARRRGVPPWMLALWGGWLVTTAVCMVIYLLSDFGGYPWPIWVAGPWGAILLMRTLQAYASGDPHRYVAETQDRRDRVRDRRHRGRFDRHGFDRGGLDRGGLDRGRDRFDREAPDDGELSWEQSDRRARYYSRQYRWR